MAVTSVPAAAGPGLTPGAVAQYQPARRIRPGSAALRVAEMAIVNLLNQVRQHVSHGLPLPRLTD
jgi:hypothetical protein